MEYIIRPMEEADRSAVLEMMRVFYASEAVLSNGSEEIFKADIDACLDDDLTLEGYVFDGGQELLGYGMTARSFSTEFGKPCLWIEDIYIREAYRGAGIGAAFFRFLEEKHPQRLLRLEAERENEGAVRFYGRCGFRELPYLELIKS